MSLIFVPMTITVLRHLPVCFKIQVYVYAHDFAYIKIELRECYDLMVKDLMVKFRKKMSRHRGAQRGSLVGKEVGSNQLN